MKNYLNTLIRYMQLTLLAGSVMLITSCEEVIDIDLNSASPAVVIEGNVLDAAGPYYVKISKTVNFNEPNVFPAVSGAVVTLSDNFGNSEPLIESSPGTYKTNTLLGTPGRNYFLAVDIAGENYQAQAFMYAPISIDTIIVDSLTFGPTTNKFLNVKFTDPAGVKNFYRIIEIINGDTLEIINIANDEFEDGQQMTVPVFSDEDPTLESGDNVVIYLQCIDENVYKYLWELSQIINSRGPGVAAPANPTSNLSNNALGFFSAHSQRSKSIQIP